MVVRKWLEKYIWTSSMAYCELCSGTFSEPGFQGYFFSLNSRVYITCVDLNPDSNPAIEVGWVNPRTRIDSVHMEANPGSNPG
jgi:hypothetical protein